MDFITRGYSGNTNWYWYVLTLGLIFIGWRIIGSVPLFLTAYITAGSYQAFSDAVPSMFMSLGINSNFYLFLILFTFILGLVGLYAGVKFFHQKSFTSIITSRAKIDWNRIILGFLLWFVVSFGFIYMDILTNTELVWNFKPVPFFTLVVVSFLFIPLQTSFEELLMRGYLMQAFGIWAKNRWMPLVATTLIFGLLHGANPEVEKLGWGIMVFYIGTGLFYGITTLMDEGTELALGLHAANNIVAALFITADWTAFKTEALYIDKSEPLLSWHVFIPVFVLYPLMLLYFSKKYKWHNWQYKLAGKVQKPWLIAENLSHNEDV